MSPMRSAIVLGFLALAGKAGAEYVRVELVTVPVDRLLKNLRAIVERDPKDASALINLARAHAMAYSLRAETLQVVQDRPDQLWFGYEPPAVPFNRVVPTEDPERLKTAKLHLETALKLYADVLKLKPDDLRSQLGRAWLLSQGDPKTDSIEPLRRVITKAWESEKDAAGWGGSYLGMAAEASGYLIPLLDPLKDEKEIALYQARTELMKLLPRTVTPIAVPLRPGLTATDLEDRSARVRFDADGSGIPREWSWITRDAAWLVHDPRRSARITSALQLFGSVTFWMFWDSGYAALEALDDDRDGRLAGKELEGLALWRDADGDGISDAGEVRPLAEWGITALSCRGERDLGHPDLIAWSPQGATFQDGSVRPTFDLVLHSR